MPYAGQTIQIPCTGGWDANPNYDSIKPEAMHDVENINIDAGGRKPRGGSERINDTTISGSPAVMGIFQFILEGGINYAVDESGNYWVDENGYYLVSGAFDIIVATSDGNIYKNYMTCLKTGLSLNQYYSFEQYYNKLYITNGVDRPQEWDGIENYTWDMGTPKKCTVALAGLGAGNVNSGVHYYKVTFVSASGESSGSPASNSVTTTAGNGQVALTYIQVGISGTTSRKIYRTAAGGSDYKLLDTISDNTTTTYADNIADASLTDAIPTTNTAFLPSDWEVNYPKIFIKHSRGLSQRLCALGVASYPNAIYLSASKSTDISDANCVKIEIMALGSGLSGAVESAGNLIIGDDRKAYILDDTMLNTMNWGYSVAIWDGGVAHQRLIVKTPTDIMFVDKNLELYSLSAAQTYGDYKLASITRPAMINRWIDDNVDKTQIDKFHAEYDPKLRAIKIFMVLTGDDYPKVALVYFIDYGWTKHVFAVNHVSSTTARDEGFSWYIYTGSDDGYVRKLESSSLLDDGAVYETNFTHSSLTFENPRSYKRYDRVWLVVKPQGGETYNVLISIDNTALAAQTVTMAGAVDALQEYPLDIGRVGQRIKTKVYNTLGENYYIAQLMYDYTNLGAQGK